MARQGTREQRINQCGCHPIETSPAPPYAAPEGWAERLPRRGSTVKTAPLQDRTAAKEFQDKSTRASKWLWKMLAVTARNVAVQQDVGLVVGDDESSIGLAERALRRSCEFATSVNVGFPLVGEDFK
jgi:hypothetical protein